MCKAIEKKVCLSITLSLVAITLGHAGLAAEEIYEKTAASVLTLEVENFKNEKFVGSAFLILRPGLFVTAWHVVHDAKKIEATFNDQQRAIVFGLVAKDESRDLAFFEIEPSSRPILKLATQKPRVGAKIFVIGAPQGLECSLAEGLIGQMRDMDGAMQYQLSCPISPGNSGGPVFNDQGEVLGMISWRKLNAQNISFAVPAFEIARAQFGDIKAASTFERKGLIDHLTVEPVSAVREAGLKEFKKVLAAQKGNEVSITLDDGKKQQRFTFVVPKM